MDENRKITRISSNRAVREAAKWSVGAATGGTARQIRQRTLGAKTTELAEKTAKKIQQRKMREYKEGMQEADDEKSKNKKKLSGPGYNILLTVAIIEDIIDLFITFTGVGAIIVAITSTIISFATVLYFVLSGVKMSNRKMVTAIVGWVVDVLGLPTNALSIILIKILENNNIDKITNFKKSALAKKILSKT